MRIFLESEHQRFVEEIVLCLSLVNGEFLIKTMWTDETSKRQHRPHPTVLGVDVTFRVNAEKFR